MHGELHIPEAALSAQLTPADSMESAEGRQEHCPLAAEIRITIITLDGHLGQTIHRVQTRLQQEVPGLLLSIHPASDWMNDTHALAECHEAIEQADIIICTMLFMEPHINAVLPNLKARAEHCDAIVGVMSDNQIVKLTRLGKLDLSKETKGPMAYLKKLRGRKPSAGTSAKASGNAAKSQMKTLRMLPKILKYIPGSAQDLRVYFLILQCWLAGSETNISNLVRLLIKRYPTGQRKVLREHVCERELIEYPETGLYHPHMTGKISGRLADVPLLKGGPSVKSRRTVGLLLMRSYVLADNTKHYDAVISAFESQGLRVIPAFASGLDARPAIEAYFQKEGRCTIDCLVSLTGFSLVGGPAYNDAVAAQIALQELDIPYIAAHSSEFQSLEQWQKSDHGLTPIEATLMVAIPELDGASGSQLYAGHEYSGKNGDADKLPIADRVQRLAARVSNLMDLKHTARKDRKLGIVLFNFPPNAGAVGTAAYLAVFESLFNTLQRLANEGYTVQLPASADALREQIIEGNSARYGSDANVLATVPTDAHVRNTPWLDEIEKQWGPAPGKQLSTGSGILVLGLQLGNITIGLQPGFGYEGDPMRLLYEHGSAPTHAFVAFYRHLQVTLDVDALLHFGTHGALEFMPGKQTGLSGDCWPERLIDAVPNFYFYAANNPSEGTIAKRRSAATLISYLTPCITQAGLYRGLNDMKSSLLQWKQMTEHDSAEADELRIILQSQAQEIDFTDSIDFSSDDFDDLVDRMSVELAEIESEFIPNGMHVIGKAPSLQERAELLHAYQSCADGPTPSVEEVHQLLMAHEADDTIGCDAETLAQSEKHDSDPVLHWQNALLKMNQHLKSDDELTSLIKALDTRFVSPAPGGDVLKSSETLPTGRNIHGFDPFRLPTALAQRMGERHASLLLDRYQHDSGVLPRSVAFVLWGSDNMKNEGVPIAQVMALLGARPRLDSYGKLCGAELIPLAQLGRPRVDVMITLSGVFRDLLPMQTRMLAEAALLAAKAEEPLDMNHVRRHTLEYMRKSGCDLETAALRVFSNADGAYGANVNLLIDSGAWTDESELADTYAKRKCYAFDASGKAERHMQQLENNLSNVDIAYQNLESNELGVTQLDYYFDTLGGINSMIKKNRGRSVPTYIGDQTQGDGKVRTLQEQVALETRSRMLNPKWYEGQLKHGYEGVRSIEQSITNTLGLSATTGQVSPWVYKQMAQTFILDEAMRDRLAKLNPTASARMANRLLEAHERNYWSPSDDMLQALHEAGDELEDRLEGVYPGVAA